MVGHDGENYYHTFHSAASFSFRKLWFMIFKWPRTFGSQSIYRPLLTTSKSQDTQDSMRETVLRPYSHLPVIFLPQKGVLAINSRNTIKLFAHFCVNIPKTLSLKMWGSPGNFASETSHKLADSGWILHTGCSLKVNFTVKLSLVTIPIHPDWVLDISSYKIMLLSYKSHLLEKSKIYLPSYHSGRSSFKSR